MPLQACSVRGVRVEDKAPAGVQVWHAGLDVGADRLAQLARTLSADETARAGRFHFDHDRRRFVAARGILRELLAGCSGVEPARLAFHYGPHGKPFLRQPPGSAPLFFNLAHSGAHAVIAVTSVADVGIDIEVIRPVPDAAAIASRCFSDRERATLENLPAADRDVAFFHAWTRKEAWVKAVGAGLSYPLQSFDVSLTPGEPAAVLRAPADTAAWSIADLSGLPTYAAAIVVMGEVSPG